MSSATITVGMLEHDANTEVHLTGNQGSGRQKVHTDATCRHLTAGKTHTTRTLGELPADWPVCRTCLGVAENPSQLGTDVNETRRELLETSPEELGLSPLGTRRDHAGVADGGDSA